MMDWQPIETAPRDRPILVYGCEESGNIAEFGQRVAVAEFYEDMELFSGSRPLFVYAPSHDKNDGPSRVITPSHWMPLPEPPK